MVTVTGGGKVDVRWLEEDDLRGDVSRVELCVCEICNRREPSGEAVAVDVELLLAVRVDAGESLDGNLECACAGPGLTGGMRGGGSCHPANTTTTMKSVF